MIENTSDRTDVTTSTAAARQRLLGEEFEPLLRDACNGQLGHISWFRADWQRGGARTGRAIWTGDDGAEAPVVVKIPVGPTEYLWNGRLQPNETDSYGVIPTLLASDTVLGGYDFAWIVMERFPEGPLFSLKREDAMELMADAAARFYKRSSVYPVDRPPRTENWEQLFERTRSNLQTNALPELHRWRSLVKTVHKQLPKLEADWTNRPIRDWCHGDLHPANFMSRSNEQKDPAMLIDLAEVHAGHWVEDAVYLERLYWLRPDFLEQHQPVKTIARYRKRLGLESNDDHAHLADVRRALLGATTPAFLASEGNPRYLEACLHQLEQVVPRLK